ncbi:MAG: LysR family transcriptional regulator [Proteobacteria bacterium]|nr:LysR family transcriptional regulator [Pseudomonadota bacterium]
MELRQLLQVLSVAEHRSIGKAAAALGLTQPALSKSIRRLEHELGVTLFERQPRGVTPTEFGEILLRHAKLMQVELREVRGEIEALRGGYAGSVVVGAGPSWLSRFLPLAVSRLLAKRPGVRVRVWGGFDDMLLRQLRQGDLDVVVAALPERPSPDLTWRPLTVDDLRVCARREHPLARRRRIALAQLQQQSWVLPRREVLARQRLDAIFLDKGLAPPNVLIESDSISFILETVRLTDCLGFVTSQAVSTDRVQGLTLLDVPDALSKRIAGVVHRARGSLSGGARLLIAELETICREVERN